MNVSKVLYQLKRRAISPRKKLFLNTEHAKREIPNLSKLKTFARYKKIYVFTIHRMDFVSQVKVKARRELIAAMSNNRGYDSNEYWLQLLSDNDKELNMSESYRNYCSNRDIPCLPTGDSLEELLATRIPPYNEDGEPNPFAGYTTFIMKDPFEKTDNQLSPVGKLHLSSYWDYLLITYYTQKDPTRFFEQRLARFLNEIVDYYDSEGNECLKRFMCFAAWAMENGLKDIKSENWYDIPPMLCIIGTLHSTISEARESDITFYCQTALKGLPPRLVKLPLKKYGLKDFSGRNIDEYTVSTIVSFNNCDVMKSCASLLFSTIQFA